MGAGYYEPDDNAAPARTVTAAVNVTAQPAGYAFSAVASEVRAPCLPARSCIVQALGQSEMHLDCDPMNRQIICRNKVRGSRIAGLTAVLAEPDHRRFGCDWQHGQLVKGHLRQAAGNLCGCPRAAPTGWSQMLFGQLMLQNYLPDPAICFSAVGDANSDEAPLQVPI